MHSPKFNAVKRYFDAHLWTTKMVQDAVDKGWITQEERDKIIGASA